jgi:hypothetical protein
METRGEYDICHEKVLRNSNTEIPNSNFRSLLRKAEGWKWGVGSGEYYKYT